MTKRILIFICFLISISTYSQTYFPFKKNKKWGVYNKTNKEVFITEFDSIAQFSKYYQEDFSDAHPYSIAYKDDYKKIINYKGEILLDNLIEASKVYNYEESLVLKANYILPFYKFSKNNKQLHGYFYPEKDSVIVPDIYNKVSFYFGTSDEQNLYYYGYNPKKRELEIFDISNKQFIKSIPCDSHNFDSELASYSQYENLDNRAEDLFIITTNNDQKTILNFKGEIIIPQGFYKEITVLSNQISLDNKVYDLKGDFLRKVNSSSNEEDEEEVEETVFSTISSSEPSYSDLKLEALGNNTFSIEKLDIKFKVNKKWKDIKLLSTNANSRYKVKPQYISFFNKEKIGVYDFKNEDIIIKPQYTSIVFDFYFLNQKYTLFDNLLSDNGRYEKEKSLELFSIKNKEGKYNFYDTIKKDFIFSNWSDSISIFSNYDYLSFHDYLLIKNDNLFKLFDFNGTLLLDNIKYLSLKNKNYNSSEKTHKTDHFDNKLELDRYIYVSFYNGDAGYFYIDNKTWEVKFLFPSD